MAFDFHTVACRGPEPRVAPQLGEIRVGVATRENGELLEVRDPIHGRGPSQHVRGHVARGSPSGGRCARAGWVWLLLAPAGFAALARPFCPRGGCRRVWGVGSTALSDWGSSGHRGRRFPALRRQSLPALRLRFVRAKKEVTGACFGSVGPGLWGRLRHRRRVGLPSCVCVRVRRPARGLRDGVEEPVRRRRYTLQTYARRRRAPPRPVKNKDR